MITFKQYIKEVTKKDLLLGFDKITTTDIKPEGKISYGIIYDDEGGWFLDDENVKRKKLPNTAVYIKHGIFKQPGKYGKMTYFYITDQKLLNNLKKLHDDYWDPLGNGIAPPNEIIQAYNNYFKFFIKNGNTPDAPTLPLHP